MGGPQGLIPHRYHTVGWLISSFCLSLVCFDFVDTNLQHDACYVSGVDPYFSEDPSFSSSIPQRKNTVLDGNRKGENPMSYGLVWGKATVGGSLVLFWGEFLPVARGHSRE